MTPNPPITALITPKPKDIGGFMVRRALPSAGTRRVGPFVFLDEMGPSVFAPGTGLDVRPHPHIGLATVTYLFDGRILHRDTLGVEQAIEPGALNLMTAGRGIVHSERTLDDDRAKGFRLHGIQAWLALPKGFEESDPGFVHHPAKDLPVVEQDGCRIRMILGRGFGVSSPAATAAPSFYAHVEARDGAALILPGDVEERAVYVVSGALTLGDETIEAGMLATFDPGAEVMLTARGETLAMALGGAALGEPRHMAWNFVASDQALIDQAKDDWRASIAGGFSGTRFTLPEGESEWIALPEDTGGSAENVPPEPTPDCPTT